MVLSMSRPTTRPNSQNAQFHRRVPSHILKIAKGRHIALELPSDGADGEPIRKTIKVGAVLRFSLETPKDNKALRDKRQGAVLQQLEKAYEAIVEAHSKGPRRLSDMECHALAGIIYRAFAEGLEQNPISPTLWARIQDENEFAMNGPLPKWTIADTPEQQARLERAAMLNRRFGPFVDAVLLREGVICDGDSRDRLLFAFARAMNEAATKLKRNAEGDYRKDETALRFPEWERNTEVSIRRGSVSLIDLFERWAKEALAAGRTQKTISEYRSTIRRFVEFLGHDDAIRMERKDVVRWKDRRLENGVSAKTVHGSDLSALKSVFGWAEMNGLVPANPAKGVSVRVGKKLKERPQGFTDDEASALLNAALAYKAVGAELEETAAAKRWAPWLCAYTGARIGEIVQLRRKDFRRDGEKWVMTITPEAGTVKNKEMREVPLHPHLIDLGLLAFIHSRGEGHLFVASGSGTSAGKLRGVTNRVTEFARSIIPDPRIRPNHAWRHRFVSTCTEEGVHERVINAICGHAPSNVAQRYGDVSMKAKWDAMRRLPRIEPWLVPDQEG